MKSKITDLFIKRGWRKKTIEIGNIPVELFIGKAIKDIDNLKQGDYIAAFYFDVNKKSYGSYAGFDKSLIKDNAYYFSELEKWAEKTIKELIK